MSDTIERLNKALEGRYRVIEPLGEGGMANVYLAEDVKHDRKVALKVLKPELAAVIGGERFVAEIKTTASLQHPHILPLFDSGEADTFLYYVMPFVDGETLRDKLDRERQLGIDESIDIAKAVASALQYAHEHDVVHRDIKPENILMHSGQPVVADFGIALAISAAGGGRMTETGLSLGTPHYMSPEQATADRDLTARSDVYSLACVLYEMLAGDPPHTGPSAQAVLMRILTEAPRDVTDVRKSVPTHIRSVLAKALEKLPADRFESAEEFRNALTDEGYRYRPRPQETGEMAAVTAPVPAATTPGRSWMADSRSRLSVAANALLLMGVLFLASRLGAPADPVDAAGSLPAHRYEVGMQVDPQSGVSAAPNGTVAFISNSEGSPMVFTRLAGQVGATAVAGTEGAAWPAFSPDGEWIAFSADGQLKKVPTLGGPVVPLANAQGTQLWAKHWGDNGMIVFSAPAGLYIVPDVGGDPEMILEASPINTLRDPFLLPGGGAVMFSESATGFADPSIGYLDLESGEKKTLTPSGAGPVWIPTGHVLWAHPSGSLFAAPFDLDAGELTAPAAPVHDSVAFLPFTGVHAISSTGTTAAFTGGTASAANQGGWQPALLHLDGSITVLPIQPTDHQDGSFSADGRRIGYTRADHIWTYDLEIGRHPQLTNDGSNHHDPLWSPDGSRLLYGATGADGSVDVFVADAVSGESEVLVDMPGDAYPRDFSPDGKYLVFSIGPTPYDLWTLDLESGDPPRPYLDADWNENRAQVSPDGRWLAYSSNETGTDQIYVRSFPEPGSRIDISEPGASASDVFWAPDGNVIYYGQNGILKAADVGLEDGTLAVTGRREVGPYAGVVRDIHPDGDRFLLFSLGDASTATPTRLVVIANWFSELKARLGEGN